MSNIKLSGAKLRDEYESVTPSSENKAKTSFYLQLVKFMLQTLLLKSKFYQSKKCCKIIKFENFYVNVFALASYLNC